ncbi:hypothetical protein [Streptomonospora wellingtoniae]|uniref:Uncharacterized protein n=1 Tax=Streptomonospora wellingtoniae TaxID=3075544 RepID=A0ABU2KMY9_9ACTN|nr:hypothetical protein [Streptomonospora sp. DSM 45055]MDT0300636.1 hypothetical protein [Streptomonospora sp. DSM 45055]
MGRIDKPTKIVAAAVGGYVLGRRKKLKLAVGLGLFLAAKKLDLDPRTLMKELGELPAVTELKDQARGQLSTVGKDVAGSMVTAWAGGLADSLNERSERLRSGTAEVGEPSGEAGEPSDQDSGRGTEAAGKEKAPGGGEANAPAGQRGADGKSAGGRARGNGRGADESRSTARSRSTRKSSDHEGDQHG